MVPKAENEKAATLEGLAAVISVHSQARANYLTMKHSDEEARGAQVLINRRKMVRGAMPERLHRLPQPRKRNLPLRSI